MYFLPGFIFYQTIQVAFEEDNVSTEAKLTIELVISWVASYFVEWMLKFVVIDNNLKLMKAPVQILITIVLLYLLAKLIVLLLNNLGVQRDFLRRLFGFSNGSVLFILRSQHRLMRVYVYMKSNGSESPKTFVGEFGPYDYCNEPKFISLLWYKSIVDGVEQDSDKESILIPLSEVQYIEFSEIKEKNRKERKKWFCCFNAKSKKSKNTNILKSSQ